MRSENAKLAHGVLSGLEKEILEVVNAQKNFRRPPAESARAVAYLRTVKEGTDTKANRIERERLISEVLPAPMFKQLDTRRAFGADQRRLLWIRSNRRCGCCNEGLTFDKAHIDHVKPFIHGGQTTLSNGRVLCKSCNLRRGAGRACPH